MGKQQIGTAGTTTTTTSSSDDVLKTGWMTKRSQLKSRQIKHTVAFGGNLINALSMNGRLNALPLKLLISCKYLHISQEVFHMK
jgi:hypothetical protein